MVATAGPGRGNASGPPAGWPGARSVRWVYHARRLSTMASATSGGAAARGGVDEPVVGDLPLREPARAQEPGLGEQPLQVGRDVGLRRTGPPHDVVQGTEEVGRELEVDHRHLGGRRGADAADLVDAQEAGLVAAEQVLARLRLGTARG